MAEHVWNCHHEVADLAFVIVMQVASTDANFLFLDEEAIIGTRWLGHFVQV